MDLNLLQAFENLDYGYILCRLEPLFLKHLRGVPRSWQDDFLQEYRILCVRIVKYHYAKPTIQ